MALEDLVKRLSTYLWLSERWSACYASADEARITRDALNDLIERALASKALKRTCKQCGKPLPASHRFPICDQCHRGNREDRYDRDEYDDDWHGGRRGRGW